VVVQGEKEPRGRGQLKGGEKRTGNSRWYGTGELGVEEPGKDKVAAKSQGIRTRPPKLGRRVNKVLLVDPKKQSKLPEKKPG